jgi:glycosyltransferase involved in cell wall biosynthesis
MQKNNKDVFGIIDVLVRRLPDNTVVNKLVSYLVSLILHKRDSDVVYFGRSSNNDKIYNKSNPLISIYVPTYNRSLVLLERAVATVLGQTYKNFELIIADDGSVDDTESVVRSINDKRIRYIKVSRAVYRYPNRSFYHWLSGPVIAANAALSECKGLWVSRIDDDDLWTEDHLDKLLKLAQNGNYEFVSSDLLVHNNSERNIIKAYDDPKDPTGIGATQTWLYRNYLKEMRYNIHSWRKAYFRVNDTDLQYRMYKVGVKIGYLNEVTAIITPRPNEDFIGSQAYINNPRKYEDFYTI